jgi:hypothetical protein
LDSVQNGEQNEEDVKSDCELIMSDLITFISQYPILITNGINITGDLIVEPIYNYGDADVYGVSTSLSFQLLNKNNTYCLTPINTNNLNIQ